jgi:hypothetical protein
MAFMFLRETIEAYIDRGSTLRFSQNANFCYHDVQEIIWVKLLHVFSEGLGMFRALSPAQFGSPIAGLHSRHAVS